MDTTAKMTFLDIPDEILEKIFLQLSTHDVQQNLAKVCKRFLKVSRFSTMVSKISLTIENMAEEDEMEKVETAVRLFPASSLELTYQQDYFRVIKGRNEFRFENFEPFVSSLTKLTLEINERNDFRRMTETQIRFLALEYLELDIGGLDTPYLKIPDRFLDNFPNLTSLTIDCDNCELFHLLDALSERCPKLERFIYRNLGSCGEYIWCIEYDYKNKGKLMNLKKIHVEFDPDWDFYFYEQEEMPRLAIEMLKKYLSVICPNLDDPIQVDEEEYGTIVFESGPPET